MSVKYIYVIILSCYLAGCVDDDEPSDDIKTSKMYAEFEVVTDIKYGYSEVFSRIREKNKSGKYIRLGKQDTFWAERNGERKELLPAALVLGSSSSYSESFEGVAENTVFSISLNRQNHTDATNSMATLPAPFEIDFPSNSSTLQRGSDITFIWTPGQPGWTMEIHTRIFCNNGVGGETIFEFEDVDGIGVLNPEEHSPPSALEYDGDCSFYLTFSRINEGTVDANFAGGYFKAIQRREIHITTTGG